MNECSKQDICGVGGQCVNLPGSYKCECHSGFRSKSHRHPVCEGTKTFIIKKLWILAFNDKTVIMNVSLKLYL